mmetsp:Transcript_9432/g.25100  ORF Transcript_9432/g.25100 Transcript_9432/m.25100 type:complete len:116 (-) Transcript_9432:273-620(-)
MHVFSIMVFGRSTRLLVDQSAPSSRFTFAGNADDIHGVKSDRQKLNASSASFFFLFGDKKTKHGRCFCVAKSMRQVLLCNKRTGKIVQTLCRYNLLSSAYLTSNGAARIPRSWAA